MLIQCVLSTKSATAPRPSRTEQSGPRWWLVLGAKLEGFMAKRRVSTYTPGAISRDWRKVKRTAWLEGRTCRA
jgi:ATP-dependent DNA ligase